MLVKVCSIQQFDSLLVILRNNVFDLNNWDLWDENLFLNFYSLLCYRTNYLSHNFRWCMYSNSMWTMNQWKICWIKWEETDALQFRFSVSVTTICYNKWGEIQPFIIRIVQREGKIQILNSNSNWTFPLLNQFREWNINK